MKHKLCEVLEENIKLNYNSLNVAVDLAIDSNYSQSAALGNSITNALIFYLLVLLMTQKFLSYFMRDNMEALVWLRSIPTSC